MLVKQLEMPYSGCTHESDAAFFKKFGELNYRYNRMDCRDLCKQKRIEDVCGCFFPRLLIIYRNNSCVSKEDFVCVDNQFASFDKAEFNDECNELCPLECDKMILSTVYSQSNHFSSELTRQLLRRQLVASKFANESVVSTEELEKSVVKLNIFYDSLSMLDVAEIPSVTEVDLISKWGGMFGLFLGLSVLSMVEIVEIFFEVALILFKKG